MATAKQSGHGTEHRQNEAMQEAAERTWPGLSEGSPRPEIEHLREIDVEAMRANLHATFNGGHQDIATIIAFHHGMDTVCNVIASYLRKEQTNGILPPSALLPSSEEG